MKNFLFVLVYGCLWICSASHAWTQNDSAQYSIQLLATEIVMQANVEVEGLGEWYNAAVKVLESEFGPEDTSPIVALLVNFHPADPPSVELSSKPALKDEQRKRILAGIAQIKSYTTQYCDFPLIVWVNAKRNDMDHLDDLSPKMEIPDTRIVREFQAMSLQDKGKELQRYATMVLIPLAAHYAQKADAAFPGVLAVGKILRDGKFRGGKIAEVTARNGNYWRAVVEMSLGNQLIPFSKMAMLLAEGEFDHAELYVNLIKLFGEEGTLPNALLPEVQFRLKAMEIQLTKEIQEGIALHDKGKYKEAIEHYKQMLTALPKSAWLQYELYYSNAALVTAGGGKGEETWKAAKLKVYACNPLYPMDVHATTGREAYLLYQRLKIKELFEKRENIVQDLIEYADIALSLEQYEFAAHLYWLIQMYIDKKHHDGRNMLSYFLYSLDKLGEKEIAKNFNLDLPKEFKKIEQRMHREMEDNIMYKSFDQK